MSAMRHDMTVMITSESLSYGAFVVDTTQRIVSWNDAAAVTLGYVAAETLGRTCEEMLALLGARDVPPCPDVSEFAVPAATDTANDARCPMSTTHASPIDSHSVRQPTDEPMRLRVITRHGVARWLSLSVVRARTAGGDPCMLHIFRDVTEQAEQHEYREVAARVGRRPSVVLRLPLAVSLAGVAHGGGDGVAMSPEHLTPREHEVLELLARGLATVEIATALGISRVTARNHVTRVIEKLGVKTRLQAVLTASRLGLI